MEEVDLLIIGAGWRGLTLAKTYHQVHPDAKLLILDSAETLGGCWAEERVYPGLHTNNPLGTYQFSDFPMTAEVAGCQPFQAIPGMGVHRYLCEAVKFFDIEQFLRVGWKVQSARLREDDTWEVISSSSKDPSNVETTIARKLVVATGLASEPYMPSLRGQERFKGVLMHSKQLKPKSDELSTARNVIVLGGNKSAYDSCYQVAQAGGVAHMVLRPSGGGPSFQWPRLMQLFGRMKPFPVLTSTRFFTLFDPWPFSTDASWMRDFLHRWTIGLHITQAFWSSLTSAFVQRLTDDERTKMLVPWASTYWMGTALGTLNYPTDWHQLVREGRIVIHHAEVVSLSPTGVELTDGLLEDVDAVICSTGWRSISPIQFLPGNLDLGLTSLPKEAGDEEALYRYMIPPTKRFIQSHNLAFFAADNPLHFVPATQIQALWITAFFHNKISHLKSSRLDLDKVREDTMLLTEYERLRRPKTSGGVGERYGEFVFDCFPYLDGLMQDLGLRSQRKKTLWKEWFEPYGIADFKGLVEEWMESNTDSKR
ncbi:hypothetical protein M409DRAFT_70961 [Zasmidium cellare ATCC 36951]|uniref:Uncharacterized protein n=1 Tax=Zasmidium cellare ATCC 36951 TaxID=1080233 RepID=A0A6A6BXJ4_ZASCE|nr:uncharacterized protein M409DRAFT_70961 [Zasmidium cellare ATCC 36951]KAF2159511.1 hypothetical protein M409DRAFT_70961 [Zasmidium cellare ATCC 36951]